MPKWLDKPQTTRSRSKKQESRIAKELRGKSTINSGATFGQNDVITDYADIEAKTTQHNSYSLKLDDWHKLEGKTKVGKLSIMVIDFEKTNEALAVIGYDDLKYLISLANSKKIPGEKEV